MELIDARSTYIRITFNEANIIMENIKTPNRRALLARVSELQNNAADANLREDAKVLLWKLGQMSEADYIRLREAAQQGLLLFPGNYHLTESH